MSLNHDAPYISRKISAPNYQTSYKFIRDIKGFDTGKFKDLKLMPVSTVYYFDIRETNQIF